MPEGGYKIRDQNAVHFLTFTVVDWIDIFSRAEYRHVFLNNIRHSQRESGLLLHAWVLMTNHFHALMSAKESYNLSDIVRDLKKYSAVDILKAVEKSEHESRQKWMLEIFERTGRANSRNLKYQFWIQDNHPKECHSHEFTKQKMEYIHNNPMRAEIVSKPEDYLYSSAIDYAGGKGLLHLDFLW